MRVTLTWPFGRYRPGEVIDCDPTLGKVLVREGFARATASDAVVEEFPPTLAQVLAYATEHDVTTAEARRHFATQFDRPSKPEEPPC